MKSILGITAIWACSFVFGGEWAPPEKVEFIEDLLFKSVDSNSAVGLKVKAVSLNQNECTIHVLVTNRSKSAISWLSTEIESVGELRLKKRKDAPSGDVAVWKVYGAAPAEAGSLIFDPAKYFELQSGVYQFNLKIDGLVGRSVGVFSKENTPLEIEVQGITIKVP